MPTTSLNVINLEQATFECTFGRGCEGLCCKNGRPLVYPEESERIDAALDRILPLLRPEARKLVEKEGYVSRRLRYGHPMLRVIDQWCVFFNQGCVLHTLGAEEGNALRYKPVVCALFPIEANDHGDWYVRQWGYDHEQWDLFCLNPANSKMPASESLKAELDLVAELDAAEAEEDFVSEAD